MAFNAGWNVVSGEVATAAKFSQLGENDDFLKNAVDRSTPTGTVAGYLGTDDPTGWLIANGRVVSRTTYAALFAKIGTAYGEGDGSTTFALPNLNGRTLVGIDGSGEHPSMGAVGGAKYHTLTEAQMPSHGHGVADYGHQHSSQRNFFADAGGGGNLNMTGGGNRYAQGQVNVQTNTSGANIGIYGAGGSQPHNNLQPYFTANWIIKT